VYGEEATAQQIIKESKFAAPQAGRHMVSRLQKASPQLKP
jgi:hypothetical protein